MRRRACGLAAMISPICPCRTRAGERAPEEASANSNCTSRARTSRPLSLIGRAVVALDAPDDLDHVGIVEGGGRGAGAVVEHQHDFGVVARRPRSRAREDDVVHAGGAHLLVGVLAHHPAQGFHEVRLAAAVRSHHARQARLDGEVGRLDKTLEADEAQPVEFHGPSVPEGEMAPSRARNQGFGALKLGKRRASRLQGAAAQTRLRRRHRQPPSAPTVARPATPVPACGPGATVG